MGFYFAVTFYMLDLSLQTELLGWLLSRGQIFSPWTFFFSVCGNGPRALSSTSVPGFLGSCFEFLGLTLEHPEYFLLLGLGILLHLNVCGTWWVFWFSSWLTVFHFSFSLVFLSKGFFYISHPFHLCSCLDFCLDPCPQSNFLTQGLFVTPMSGVWPNVCSEGHCGLSGCRSSHPTSDSGYHGNRSLAKN